MTSTPTACFFMPSVKARATSRATSASSIDRRTSRNAPSTSASLSAPRRVRRSRTPPSFSDRLSNIASPETAHLATDLQTFLRPRAHRAVGRLPPASYGPGGEAELSRLYRERAEPRVGVWPSQGESRQVKTSQNKSKQVKTSQRARVWPWFTVRAHN